MISYGSFRKRSLTKHFELLVIKLSNQRNFSLLLGAGGLSLSLEDCLHLLALSLSSDVGAETLLGELQASLVFRHLQQLQTTLLVRSESRNRKKETALHHASDIFNDLPAMLLLIARQNIDGAVSEIFNAYRLLTDHPSGIRYITIFFDFLVCTQEIDTHTDIDQ